MTKLRMGIIVVIVAAGVAVPWLAQHHALVELREANETLRQSVARLQEDNDSLSNRAAQAEQQPVLRSERLRELLRLRGEASLLRRQLRELERGAATAGEKPQMTGLPGETAASASPLSNQRAPVQVQLVLDEPGDNTESITNASGNGEETLNVQKTPLLDHTAIRLATVKNNISTGAPEIDIEFSDVGRELFAAITKENLNRRLAITLDGHLYAAPVIREEISGGKAQVTGAFSAEEARQLAAKINEAIAGK